MEVPQKTENRNTIWSGNPTPWNLSKEHNFSGEMTELMLLIILWYFLKYKNIENNNLFYEM